MARVSPPSSSAVVEISDELVERYAAQGWTVQGSPEPAEKPKAQAETKAAPKAARRSK